MKIGDLNWNAGIKFSLIKNRPYILDPITSKKRLLGVFKFKSCCVETDDFDDSGKFIKDYVTVLGYSDNGVFFNCSLPGYYTYMIGIQGTNFHNATVQLEDDLGSRFLNMVDLVTNDGMAGVTDIKPIPAVPDKISQCTIIITVCEKCLGFAMHGITITRL